MKGAFTEENAGDFPALKSSVWTTVLLGVAFSALYAAGMPGYDVPALPFVCLVPLLVLSTTSANARQAARRGFF
ncbi:MAG: hypothetical protein R3239_08045, partial [Thermodesulfobacteriota bacterium]|nr:hypothetical protein [Thermodesulfobacteriota bacterium]